jgi:HEAT repeat protein
MTFFCVECFERLPSESERCPRCGSAQNIDQGDYAAKLRKALSHPMAETRRRVIYLLGEKRIVEAVGELVEILDHESDPFLVEEAADALGKIGGDKALAALVRAAQHKSFLVRARAIQTLARAGGAWKESALQMAERDPSAMVRESVCIKE